MIDQLLPPGSTARRTVLWVGPWVLLLLVTQVIFSGGTPVALLFQSAVLGSIMGLLAAGLVLVHRTLSIINFSQMALGAPAAVFFFRMVEFTPVPFPIAVVLAIAIGAATGAVFDAVFGRRFFAAPRIVLTVLTIVAAPFIANFLAPRMRLFGFFPSDSELTIGEISGGESVRDALPLAGFDFSIGSFALEFGFAEIFAIQLVVLSLLALVGFLRFTRLGVGIRGLSQNSERAALLGISVGALSTAIWALSGAIGAASAIAIGSVQAPASAVGAGAFFVTVLPAFAGAVIARMESIPVAVAAATWITVFNLSFNQAYPREATILTVLMLVYTGGSLLLRRGSGGRSEEGAGVSWAAVREIRPIPVELAGVPTVKAMRWGAIAVALAILVLWPFVFPVRLVDLGSAILIQAILGISLVVLTGWAGQISLGQVAFAAVGGVIGGALTEKVGIPFWFAVPIATAFTGGFAALVGIPALRIKGLYLAVITLILGIAVPAFLFDERFFGWLLPDQIDRPTLFFLDFEDDTSMYFLSAACLVLTVFVVVNLRRSRFGRLLIGIRDNEPNAQAFGVSTVRLKVTAFAVSGALAGFEGAVFVHQQRGLDEPAFQGLRGINIFTNTVLGGIASPIGALLGSAFDAFTRYFTGANELLQTILDAFAFGGFALLMLYIAPGGLVSVIASVRDAVLRIIAQRRQIIAPSLFADYDPAALEHRLVPLADSSDKAGLAATGGKSRYRLPSAVHRRSVEDRA